MAKAISYALYGYSRPQNESCFSFASYLRGFSICLRMNRLLYPQWTTIIHVDNETYFSFQTYFVSICKDEKIRVIAFDYESLCKNMLWRLKPIFEQNYDANAKGYTGWKYSHVICRDVDSPATYREVQAVEQWIAKDTALHAITDSVSHHIPLLGGMIGFRPNYFTERMGTMDWDELMRRGNNFDFNIKGSDQDFLNQVVYQKFAQSGSDSIVQHYFNGMPNTFLQNYLTCTCPPPSGHREDCHNNYRIDLPEEMKESNSICGHIGSSGSYQSATERFLRKFRYRFNDIHEAESKYPDIFYWTKDKSLG